MNDISIFDLQYFEFVYDIISMHKDEENQSLIVPIFNLCSEMMNKIVSHSHNSVRSCLEKWTNLISDLIKTKFYLIEHVITWRYDEPYIIIDNLLVCNVEECRINFSNLMVLTYKSVKEKSKIIHGNQESPRTFFQAVDSMIECIKSASFYWKNFEQFFNLLLRFSEFGEVETKYLLKMGVLDRLLDLFFWEYSPISEKKSRRVPFGDRFNKPNYNSLISLITKLISNCQLNDAFLKYISQDENNQKISNFEFPSKRETCLIFYQTGGFLLLIRKIIYESPTKIHSILAIEEICRGNLDVSIYLLKYLTTEMLGGNNSQKTTFVDYILSILQIDDNFIEAKAKNYSSEIQTVLFITNFK